jgi:hypothetical protein
MAVSNLLQTAISSLFLTFLSSVGEFKARQAGENTWRQAIQGHQKSFPFF